MSGMARDTRDRWLDRADYDLGTAEAMLTSGRFIYAVFMSQQALEKALKATLAFQGQEVPPIHNLRRLAERATLTGELSAEDLRLFDFLSQYYLNSRYKEDLQDLLKQVGEEAARQFVNFARERMAWLTRKIRP